MRGKAFRILLLAGTAITFPSLAMADPVSLVVTAATVAVKAAAGAGLIGSLTAALIGAAITIAGTLASTLLFSQQRDTGTQAQQRLREEKSHPNFRFAFGEFPQEGSLVFRKVQGGRLYETYLLNSLPSQSIDKIYLYDREITFYSNASNDLYDMSKGANCNVSPWDEELDMWIGLGDQTQFPTAFTSVFGSELPAINTASWTGATVVHVRCKWGSDKTAPARWKQGRPRFKWLGKWSKLYDPRLDSTRTDISGASGSHRLADASTWEYSANPALCALMLATHAKALGANTNYLLWQQWADAADACDATGSAVSELALGSNDWTSAPAAHVVGTAAGSGVWTYSRGTVAVGAKDDGTLGGTNSLKLHSTDTGGTVEESETGRAGVYYDMAAEGRSIDADYTLRIDTNSAGTVGQARYRVKVYQADGGGTASSADQQEKFLPPDAANITEVYDSGLQTIVGPGFTASHTVQGRYVSVVLEGGEPNESDTEWREFSSFTTTETTGLPVFRCDGLVKVETREWALLDGVLDSMAGHLDTTGGKIGVRAGVYVAPTDTLTDPIGDVLQYSGRSDVGYDKLVATYIGRHRDYQETETETPYEVGTGDREKNIGLPFVREPEQAHRIIKIFGERDKLNRTLTGTWDAREWARRIGDRVTVAMTDFPQADGVYRILGRRPVIAEDGGKPVLAVEMTLREDASATYSWTSDDYTEPVSVTPGGPVSPTLEPPESVLLEQINYTDGTTTRAKLRVTVTLTDAGWPATDDIRVEVNDGGGWEFVATIPTNGSASVAIGHIYDPTVGLTYQVRARAESGAYGISDWTLSNSVTVTTPALDYDHADYGNEYS